ncbi:MAG: RNA polymerase sigma factor [Rubripirellula sp.]|nr:RNA polymerase sigma factor [Rubripirellula sp.]
MNEQKAIRLCLKHRDPAGFEVLVVQNRRRAFFHARALLGNSEDAADACQDAFVRAFAAMPRLEKLDRFYPWFNRILRNVCLNMLARKKTRADHLRNSLVQTTSHHSDASPSDLMELKETQEEVWRVLDQLSVEHREILTLKYVHRFSYGEIAETLGIPKGTVMSRLYSARYAFRNKHEQIHTVCKSRIDHGP